MDGNLNKGTGDKDEPPVKAVRKRGGYKSRYDSRDDIRCLNKEGWFTFV